MNKKELEIIARLTEERDDYKRCYDINSATLTTALYRLNKLAHAFSIIGEFLELSKKGEI